MNMIYTYNKLVRDKIPEEINNVEGRKANILDLLKKSK